MSNTNTNTNTKESESLNTGEEFFRAAADAYRISSSLLKALEQGNYIAAKANAMQVQKLTRKLCYVLAKAAEERKVRKATI